MYIRTYVNIFMQDEFVRYFFYMYYGMSFPKRFETELHLYLLVPRRRVAIKWGTVGARSVRLSVCPINWYASFPF